MLSIADLAVVIGASVICALLSRVILSSPKAHPIDAQVPAEEPKAFLFDDGILHHASTDALTAYSLFPGAHTWSDLRDLLINRFSLFPESVANAGSGSMTILPDQKGDPGLLTLYWRDQLCWIELLEIADRSKLPEAFVKDHDVIKTACDSTPHPAWETNAVGEVVWRNKAYDALHQRLGLRADQPIFEISDQLGPRRIPVKDRSGNTDWFELESTEKNGFRIHHATAITEVVNAADAQRTFVQTLAKTFAHLPIGLAIFDRKQQLSIFNPALVDLTDLSAEILAKQPTMLSFFDALRENRRMPEPKNYNTWRKDITRMIEAAAGGHYHETWTLEDGRTYTVQGRPHPDGAIAFLFEDITAEVVLTRNYRLEVEQYEALLNTVNEPLIMFSPDGVVIFSNAAYHNAWDQNPELAFADVRISDAIEVWSGRATGDWETITDFVRTRGRRAQASLPLTDAPDGILSANLTPVGADATIVHFSRSAKPDELALPHQSELPRAYGTTGTP